GNRSLCQVILCGSHQWGRKAWNSPSCSAAHRGSHPSPAQNQNNGAAGGCEEESDAAPAVVLAVVVVVVLLLLSGLPVNPSLPSERMYDLEVAQHWLSHQC
ncbi:hypothetical protein A2U01_0071665, partial [Trifolium medium]|nr:hypothetical protein [Trifolium medium]